MFNTQPRMQPYSIEVWNQVLLHLRAGITPIQISKLEGMPAYDTICKRIRRKVLFENAYRQQEKARARQVRRQFSRARSLDRLRQGLIAPTDTKGRFFGGWRFDDRTADRIIAALARDVPIAAFAGKDGFPKAKDIHDRRAYDPAFAARVAAVAPQRYGKQRRRKSYMPDPHPASLWDEVARLMNEGMQLADIAKIEGMPTAAVISSKRIKDPLFAARVPAQTSKWSAAPTKADWDEVLAKLREGLTLTEIGRLPHTPTINRIRGKLRRDAAFAGLASQWQRIAKAARAPAPKVKEASNRPATQNVVFLTPQNLLRLRRENGWSQSALGAALGATYDQVRGWEAGGGVKPDTGERVGAKLAEMLGLTGPETKAKRLNADRIYTAADKAISKRLPDDVRMEIIANIVMAVYDGTLAAEDIPKRARDFLMAFYQENQDLKQTSLDRVVGKGGQSFGDRLGVY